MAFAANGKCSGADVDDGIAAARLRMLELGNIIAVPMALRTFIRLGLPSALAAAGAPLSAAALLPHSPDPSVLERLLRLLASYGVLQEHLQRDATGDDSSATAQRLFSLTATGRTLVPDAGSIGSFSDYILQKHYEPLVSAWERLPDAVLDPAGATAFARANGGVEAYEYYASNGEANALFQSSMSSVSEPFMAAFLDRYGGLAVPGVKTLVDVGGSSGKCLEMMMRRWSNVDAGINLDLPGVVAAAPAIPGVTHVGGDMFKSVPSGDAIFMKWLLSGFSDEECVAILRNCWRALPAGGGGKVVAVEPVVPESSDGGGRTRALLANDICIMTVYKTQGGLRSEEDYRRLGVAAGFAGGLITVIYHVDPFFAVIELHK